MRIVINETRKLPLGVQSFQSLREDHYLYVDKTEYIYQLFDTGKQYFLSRPRRFGKSLLLSTMKAYFEGKRQLFEGLRIEELEGEKTDAWQAYPVFYFDFNRDHFLKDKSLEKLLHSHVKEWERIYGCEDPDASLAVRFQHLLKRAYLQTNHRCVVLIDEYDKPLLEVMEDEALQEYNKAVFKGFFSSLKSYDEYLRFVFITGVTKFSKVSIFSDLNQLKDISLSRQYAAICGITQKEMESGFRTEIQMLAEEQELTYEACLCELKKRYDGYHFHPKSEGVFNPFSILNAFFDGELKSYWFESGTPSFLVKRLGQIGFDARRFTDDSLEATEQALSDYRADNPDPLPLLYQTGYLTIQGYDKKTKIYTLGFPNEEVKYGLLSSMMPEYMPETNAGTGKDILSIRRYAEKGDLENLKNAFIALFSGIPYTKGNTEYESYFQSVIYIVFTLLGQYVHAEVHSVLGRADCVVETQEFIYLFEFKRDKSAQEALWQMEEKGYALPYAADQRKLYKVGVNFDSARRNISEWKVE